MTLNNRCHFLSAFAIIFAMMVSCAYAQNSSVRGVIEFFTSQGCNACPPADEVLSKLAKETDIIALGYHVDYWNYRGWKDTFSTHENTVLQAGYMKAFGKRALFTPQAVINGQIGVMGSDIVAIRSQLVATSRQSRLASALPVELDIQKTEDQVIVHAVSDGDPLPNDTYIYAVRVEPERKVLIESGENKGRMITYSNIVRERRFQQPLVPGNSRLLIDATEFAQDSDHSQWIFIVQQISEDGMPGRILGARRL